MSAPSRLAASSLRVGALAGAPALAQAAPTTMAERAAIAAGGERLAGFDRLSARTPRSAPQTAPVAVEPACVTTKVASWPALPGSGGSVDDNAWDFDASSLRYDISLSAPNYFPAGRSTADPNTAPFDPLASVGVLTKNTMFDSTEAACQSSIKFSLWPTDDRRWGLWAAYAKQSQWQLYDDSGNASRPFREDRYMPALFLGTQPGLQWSDLSANYYKWRGQSVNAAIRGNPSSGKGAGRLTSTTHPLLGPLRGDVKVFSGCGLTLIDDTGTKPPSASV